METGIAFYSQYEKVRDANTMIAIHFPRNQLLLEPEPQELHSTCLDLSLQLKEKLRKMWLDFLRASSADYANREEVGGCGGVYAMTGAQLNQELERRQMVSRAHKQTTASSILPNGPVQNVGQMMGKTDASLAVQKWIEGVHSRLRAEELVQSPVYDSAASSLLHRNRSIQTGNQVEPSLAVLKWKADFWAQVYAAELAKNPPAWSATSFPLLTNESVQNGKQVEPDLPVPKWKPDFWANLLAEEMANNLPARPATTFQPLTNGAVQNGKQVETRLELPEWKLDFRARLREQELTKNPPSYSAALYTPPINGSLPNINQEESNAAVLRWKQGFFDHLREEELAKNPPSCSSRRAFQR